MVLTALRNLVTFWTTLLSEYGWIAISKMVVLPSFLHLFVAFPVELPWRFFRGLNGMLLTLYLGSSRQLAALQKLRLPVDEGRVVTSDVEVNYLAAQVQWVARWHSHLWSTLGQGVWRAVPRSFDPDFTETISRIHGVS